MRLAKANEARRALTTTSRARGAKGRCGTTSCGLRRRALCANTSVRDVAAASSYTPSNDENATSHATRLARHSFEMSLCSVGTPPRNFPL